MTTKQNAQSRTTFFDIFWRVMKTKGCEKVKLKCRVGTTPNCAISYQRLRLENTIPTIKLYPHLSKMTGSSSLFFRVELGCTVIEGFYLLLVYDPAPCYVRFSRWCGPTSRWSTIACKIEDITCLCFSQSMCYSNFCLPCPCHECIRTLDSTSRLHWRNATFVEVR